MELKPSLELADDSSEAASPDVAATAQRDELGRRGFDVAQIDHRDWIEVLRSGLMPIRDKRTGVIVGDRWPAPRLWQEQEAPGTELVAETWRQFESKALDRVPVLVDRLWPEAAFGFIAAPPKKGKTWVALTLAISVATGKPFLDQFHVPAPRPVLYVALEGHRAGLRARVGAIARGLGINPDTDQLDNLHFLYKPAGLNLADPEWARHLHEAANAVGAALVIVDVLRAAARLKENDQEAFSALRFNLQPMTDTGTSVAMLHHFGKLTETQKERDPGERMSGSGAMFGALDVAIYITGSTNNGRALRLEFDARDIAAPDHLSIHLAGEGTGENGGFTYRDTAEWLPGDDVTEDDLKAPPAEIAQYIRDEGGDLEPKYICAHFKIADKTLTARRARLAQLGIDYTGRRGIAGRYIARPTDQVPTSEQTRMTEVGTEPHNHAGLRSEMTSSENKPLPNSKVADLQGKDQFGSSELPKGEPDSVSEVAGLPGDNDEPEPFDHANDDIDWGVK